jgi:sterol desaturase/sphingolipid hydroxylase (fatty acid hydroxylase superfamily)
MQFISQNISILLEYLLWFVFCFGVFSLLAKLMPNIKEQRFLRKGMGADLMYWFLMPLFYVRLSEWILVGFLAIFYGGISSESEFSQHGFLVISSLPVLVQVVLSLLISDSIQYWTHRMFHDKTLWKFHAIHHSSRELDWLSGVRFHPANLAIHSSFVGVLVYLLGFSPEVLVFLVPFTILYSAMVHANLNWTFGPLRYVFASPVFHRWHHTKPEEGGERNFAPIFAFQDLLFGTFYMPKGKSPEKFGVSDPIPETFVGQLVYPFRK